MKRSIIIFLMIAMMSLVFFGCNKDDVESNIDVDVNEVESYGSGSIDKVTINNVKVDLQEWSKEEIYADLIINITNNFDFDCSTIGLELKVLDENNKILEDTNATIDNVGAGQSGDAMVTLNDYSNFENMNTIEVYAYGVWKKGDKEVVEGTFSKEQIFNINDITEKTMKY